ncbi:MAG: response regulator [Thermodesulfobacteriota bacterium]
MSLKDDIDLLVRQNEVLIQTLSIMGVRLDTALKQLSAIASLTAVPVQYTKLNEALDEILDVLVREITDIDSCSLLLYQPKADRLKLLAAKGQADLLDEGGGPYNSDLAFQPGEGIAGQVFTRNEPIFMLRDSPEAESLKLDPGLTTPNALACLPLAVMGRPIGVLNVSFTRPNPFDHTRRRDLILLSGVVANVIQSFLLKAELDEKAASLSKARDELEVRVRERTADLVEAVENLKAEIAERRRADEDLTRSEKRYRDLFTSISDAVFAHDLEGRLLALNPAAAEILGRPAEELRGRILADFLRPEDLEAFQETYLRQITGQGRAEGTFALTTRDGEARYIEYRCALVREGGPSPYVTGSGRDITAGVKARKEIRRLREQLLQSQKMQAIGTLASGIAHDFNNILQAISGYVQILLNTEPDRRAGRSYLEGIDEAVQRAGDLVKNLLAFSRKVKPELKPLDFNHEVRQAVKILERTIPRMIGIETLLAGDLWCVNGDATQIEQVLMNLGTNARDAMPEGGRIVIRTENMYLDEEFTRNNLEITPGPYVHLRVTDTGRGVDEETIRHAFEPFFTTKQAGQGTGLGLATVYGIVKAHGGHIRLSGRPEGGAEVDVYLPALPQQNVPPPQDVVIEEIKAGQETVLVVDDDPAVLEITRVLLEQAGYDILEADGGDKALALYRDRGDRIDFIILDLGMPELGGYRCLKEILKMNPRAKVLVASGYATQEKEALTAGASGFIAKPFRVTDLHRKIRLILDDKD